jgi:hypothetical protein
LLLAIDEWRIFFSAKFTFSTYFVVLAVSVIFSLIWPILFAFYLLIRLVFSFAEILVQLIQACKVGASVKAICERGDNLIVAEVEKVRNIASKSRLFTMLRRINWVDLPLVLGSA